jgi:hypothetical protein
MMSSSPSRAELRLEPLFNRVESARVIETLLFVTDSPQTRLRQSFIWLNLLFVRSEKNRVDLCPAGLNPIDDNGDGIVPL